MSLVAKRYLDELGWRWEFSQIHYQVHKVYQIVEKKVNLLIPTYVGKFLERDSLLVACELKSHYQQPKIQFLGITNAKNQNDKNKSSTRFGL